MIPTMLTIPAPIPEAVISFPEVTPAWILVIVLLLLASAAAGFFSAQGTSEGHQSEPEESVKTLARRGSGDDHSLAA